MGLTRSVLAFCNSRALKKNVLQLYRFGINGLTRNANLRLGRHEGLLLLLEGGVDDGEPLGGHVELGLELLRLLDQLGHLLLGLLGPHAGLLGLQLTGVRSVVRSEVGFFLKIIISVGILTHSGILDGIHTDVSRRNRFSRRCRSECRLKLSLKTHLSLNFDQRCPLTLNILQQFDGDIFKLRFF